MKHLKQAQEAIVQYLEGSSKDAPSFIIERPTIVQNPLQIYKNSILGNHLNAFKDVYSVLAKLVGTEFFEYTFKEFYRFHSNEDYDISLYGQKIPDFLVDFTPAKSLPYLADVAKLEWLCHEACLGPEYAVEDFESLSHMSEESLSKIYFTLPSASHLMESQYPILKIYEVNQDDYKGSQQVSLDEQGCKLFIWRRGLDLQIESLNESEFYCLSQFKNKQTLGDVLHELDSKFSISEQACQNILAKMIQKRWLVGFSVLE